MVAHDASSGRAGRRRRVRRPSGGVRHAVRMNRPALLLAAMTVLGSVLMAGCSGAEPEKIGPTGVDGLEVPTPSADPADFEERVDNPYFPLNPGSRWVYESRGLDQETTTVTVTDQTREVQGVATTAVHDVVTDPDGEVLEDTFDWYAQDTAGNVWFFGQDTTTYDDQGRPDPTGSWEAGVDGA